MILKKLEAKYEASAKKLNKKANKKVSFHLQERSEIPVARKRKLRARKQKKPDHRKRKDRANYKRNRKKKKSEKIKLLIDKIKEENIVVNLSQEEVPASAYLYLSNGLGYVPSRKSTFKT